MRVKKDWYKDFFRSSFYNPASSAALSRAPHEARFVLGKLKLRKGDSLLDLCCGPGRHAVEFAKKGIRVTGYDFSGDYLKEAGARARKHKVSLKLCKGDMRRLKFGSMFDAVVCLFTSFGYFEKISDDIKTLKGVARALKPSGLFLIDIVNGENVRRNFAARYWQEKEGGGVLLGECALYRDGAKNKWITIDDNGRRKERSFFNRLYTKKTLSKVLGAAGLAPLGFWGGFSGERLSGDSSRIVCLARKKR